MSEWQPIDTCPIATRVLVSYVRTQTGYRMIDIKERLLTGDFVFPSKDHEPTHWMPLPPPPKVAA